MQENYHSVIDAPNDSKFRNLCFCKSNKTPLDYFQGCLKFDGFMIVQLAIMGLVWLSMGLSNKSKKLTPHTVIGTMASVLSLAYLFVSIVFFKKLIAKQPSDAKQCYIISRTLIQVTYILLNIYPILSTIPDIKEANKKIETKEYYDSCYLV